MNSLLAFLILIGVLIFVHELGHFMWAKILGVKVLTFSLGFPPKLIGRRIGETEYVLSAIPIGGYVKMLGEEEAGEEIAPEDLKRAFHVQPVWKRFVIVFAGPFMNLAFPLFLYFAVLYVSVDQIRPATVGTVVPGDPADEAGIVPGDRIVEIDGKAIHGFEDLRDVVGEAAGRRVPIVFEHDGKRTRSTIVPRRATETVVAALGLTKEVGRIGVYPAFPRPVIQITDPGGAAARAGLETQDLLLAIDGAPVKRWIDVEKKLSSPGPSEVEVAYLRPVPIETPAATVHVYEAGSARLSFPEGPSRFESLGAASSECYVSSVRPGTPAASAGMRPGDRIAAINGQSVRVWDQLTNTLRTYPDDQHSVTFEHPDGTLVTARLRQTKRSIGDEFGQEQTTYTFGASNFNLYIEDDWVPNPNRLIRAIRGSVQGTWYYIRITGILFARLVQGKVSVRTIGGPILIFDIAGRSAREGAVTFLDTMALISVNLGLINLFPIPILDGGVILLIAIEAIRRRRLSDRARQIYQYAGMGIVGLLVVLVFYNDISRYWDRIIGFFGAG